MKKIFVITICMLSATLLAFRHLGNSSLVKILPDGTLKYTTDNEGNIIPDFSNVGYHDGEKAFPVMKVMKTLSAPASGDSRALIQKAIDEVSALTPDANGYRGAILLKKGKYHVNGSLHISQSGITLKGEGDNDNGTVLVADSAGQHSLLMISGSGRIKETKNSRVQITDNIVPVGAHSFQVSSAASFKIGDKVMLFRPGTEQWIKDLKMDQMETRPGTIQWKAKDYNLEYERVITGVEGNKITINAPVVMQLSKTYGGGELYKYTFEGRIQEVGVQQIAFESAYASDTDENHAWTAVEFNKAENCWADQVSAKYFGYACVFIKDLAKNVTVNNSKCMDPKSQITGGRRYSFAIEGQLNLVSNCVTTDGRHDYVTGGRVCGPNVFYNSSSTKTHADIGPHHRWATGTLYDNITTDGQINIQDRGNYGSGHGWAGANQVLWNCTAASATLQNPWVSANNYCIGLTGKQDKGRFKDRNNGIWEAQNSPVQPKSLYMAQLKERLGKGTKK